MHIFFIRCINKHSFFLVFFWLNRATRLQRTPPSTSPAPRARALLRSGENEFHAYSAGRARTWRAPAGSSRALLGLAPERTARDAGPRAQPQPALGTTERPSASPLTSPTLLLTLLSAPPPRALSSRALWTPGPFLRRAPPARPRQHLYRTLTPRLTFCSENRDRLAAVSLSARARP